MGSVIHPPVPVKCDTKLFRIEVIHYRDEGEPKGFPVIDVPTLKYCFAQDRSYKRKPHPRDGASMYSDVRVKDLTLVKCVLRVQ